MSGCIIEGFVRAGVSRPLEALAWRSIQNCWKSLPVPTAKTPVVLVHDGTGLKCKECHRVYPIKDDIPVMLIDEATIED